MAKICDITGKQVMFGNRVSKANNKSKRIFSPNLQQKKIFLKEMGTWIYLQVCTKAIRTINKYGFSQTMKKAMKKGTLSPKLTSLVALL